MPPPPSKKPRLGGNLKMRVSDPTKAAVLSVCAATGLTESDVVRMALNHGLPRIEQAMRSGVLARKIS